MNAVFTSLPIRIGENSTAAVRHCGHRFTLFLARDETDRRAFQLHV